MGLLHTYGAANRVIDTALHVTYSRRLVTGQWTYTQGTVHTTIYSAWEYTRSAVKVYRYVGMDEDTAKACAAAMNTLYTRATKISDWDGSSGQFSPINSGSVPMADVVCQHEDGGMWSVIVNVSEIDARMSRSATASFASLFSTERARAYDGETEATT